MVDPTYMFVKRHYLTIPVCCTSILGAVFYPLFVFFVEFSLYMYYWNILNTNNNR